MAFCTKCGAQLAPGDAFCGRCGARIQAQPSDADHKAGTNTAHRKIIGHCNACRRDWHEGDEKCSQCGHDKYTPVFSTSRSRADKDAGTEADPTSLPIPNILPWVVAFAPLIGLIIAN
ncbi:MAG: zinc-ribbon domain-containing protein, partial [Desulfovibrionales bacterium]|nr:zinc-ribbon domain-containing protein [Desulfovibrionales bacterium]